MNYFGLSAYDPLEGSSTSIDPLNSLALSVNLADLIFPGSSGRIWKIRYLSAICFLIDCADTDEEAPYKDNYLDIRRYENVLILASTLLKGEKEIPGLKGLMGTSKASRLIENSTRGYVDISGEILSNQSNLGPLGVHQVLLRSLGLIEEDNLVLTNKGKELASIYRVNLGSTGKVIEELGSKNKIDIEKLKSNLDPQAFSFNLSDKQSEAEIIFKLLIDNPQRLQLIRDMNLLRLDEITGQDEAYVSRMTAAQKSQNEVYYKMIYDYENLQRKLHVFFNHFLQSPVQQKIDTFTAAKSYLSSITDDFSSHAANFKYLCHLLSSSEMKTFQAFLNTIDELSVRLSSFEEFSIYVISELHGNHQAYKRKACWVKIENGLAIANPSNLRGENDLKETRLHRYRYANVDFILNDLGKLEFI